MLNLLCKALALAILPALSWAAAAEFGKGISATFIYADNISATSGAFVSLTIDGQTIDPDGGPDRFLVNDASATMYVGDGVNPVSATGTNNFCIGKNACYGLTNSTRNTAVGQDALLNLGTASRMTGMGWNVLKDVSSSSSLNCNAYGNLAAGSLVHCRNSNIDGVEAARFAHEVSNTFALGAFVLDASGGVHWNTVGIGYQTMTVATYTRDVTAVGNQAGIGLVSGTNVLLLGSGTNGPGTSLHNFMNLGNTIFADMNGTGQASSGGGSAKVGINVVTPTSNLHVSGTLITTSGTTVATLAAGGLTVTGDTSATNVSATRVTVSGTSTMLGTISTSLSGETSASLCVSPSGYVYRGTPNC